VTDERLGRGLTNKKEHPTNPPGVECPPKASAEKVRAGLSTVHRSAASGQLSVTGDALQIRSARQLARASGAMSLIASSAKNPLLAVLLHCSGLLRFQAKTTS